MSSGITMAAAKHIFKMCVEHFNKTGAIIDKTPTEMAEEYDLLLPTSGPSLGSLLLCAWIIKN